MDMEEKGECRHHFFIEKDPVFNTFNKFTKQITGFFKLSFIRNSNRRCLCCRTTFKYGCTSIAHVKELYWKRPNLSVVALFGSIPPYQLSQPVFPPFQSLPKSFFPLCILPMQTDRRGLNRTTAKKIEDLFQYVFLLRMHLPHISLYGIRP